MRQLKCVGKTVLIARKLLKIMLKIKIKRIFIIFGGIIIYMTELEELKQELKKLNTLALVVMFTKKVK